MRNVTSRSTFFPLLAGALVISLIGADVRADGMAPTETPTMTPTPVAIMEHKAPALERLEGPRLSAAMGHYGRARSLLIAALNEFDQGYKMANPEAILDPKAWRTTLIDRAEELDHLLDPQPRINKGGVKYQADTRLLRDPTGRK